MTNFVGFFSYSRFASSELIFCVGLINIISYGPKSGIFIFLNFSMILELFFSLMHESVRSGGKCMV